MMTVGTAAPADRHPGDDAFASLPTSVVCEGCGFRAEAHRPVPMRCPNAIPGDDIDHVLARSLDATRLSFPTGAERNPFVRYRSLMHGTHVAGALGWTDRDVVGLIDRLNEAVARVDGHGFAATPLVAADALAARLGMDPGTLLVKDETGNVAGSHKARHLMGTALALEVADAVERARRPPRGTASPARLAIASCGNAALAAAVIARAWGRKLDVFVPADADPLVVERLRRLEAEVVVAERVAGTTGDPTYHCLRAAIEYGAVPFTCQGNENGLAIEGGETLAYEMVTDLAAMGRNLDRLVIQVGGGALASSCARALDDAQALGALEHLPRIHTVQSTGAAPLVRAYDLVVDRLADRFGLGPIPGAPGERSPGVRSAVADRLREAAGPSALSDAMAGVARHRSAFMWPWEAVPHSVAHGILDDETYDWYAVVRAMVRTGGYPVVATEATLCDANDLGRAATGVDVDPTGSAGLAGLMELRRAGLVGPDETTSVLFTGVLRHASPAAAADPRPPQGAPR